MLVLLVMVDLIIKVKIILLVESQVNKRIIMYFRTYILLKTKRYGC